MQIFKCPICGDKLFPSAANNGGGNSYYCKNKHCFDVSKNGYINLLPSNKMHSKLPGDNKLMVDTRNRFLSAGYYSHLCEKLCDTLLSFIYKDISNENHAVSIVDAGCGEGYYTSAMAKALQKAKIDSSIFGIDISKTALSIASKRAKTGNLNNALYAVASVFDLPVFDSSCDFLTLLFAPFNATEYHRVLKPNGIMMLVIPAENHLIELKQAIYDKPYKNEVKPFEIDGFTFIDSVHVNEKILLSSNSDIEDLFKMTPYYYKTSKQDADKLLTINKLATTIDFLILSYSKA